MGQLVETRHAPFSATRRQEPVDAGVARVEEEHVRDPEHVRGPGIDDATVADHRDPSSAVQSSD